MSELEEIQAAIDRRAFLRDGALSLGSLALGSLLARDLPASERADERAHTRDRAPRARSVIFLFMAGGPSQLDLFEQKPKLRALHGETPPPSLIAGKRFAFLKPGAKLLGSPRRFARHGQCGASFSELLPETARIADELCFLRALTTDNFNHGPAKILLNTGSPLNGRPSMGSWILYGLGSEADDLPGFLILQSGPRGPRGGSQLWSSGFLPSSLQGVPLRAGANPILNLAPPPGLSREDERRFLEALREANDAALAETGDPEIETRTRAYEMAFRMQMKAPEAIDLRSESPATLALYGAEPEQPSFARNCLLARRLVERGVRFVQLYHTNWDHHGGPGERIDVDLDRCAREVDRATRGLILDLKARGLLEETLVVWCGEFGRTPLGEVRATTGRDHHVEAFTGWLAGAGVRAGFSHGETDELGFGPTSGRVHVHDLQATILHLLGLEHTRLTYRFQGRDFRLTDVGGTVVREILS